MKILQKQKSKINEKIGKLDTYYDSIPIKQFNDILKKFGFELVQEDGSPFAAIFCGDNSNTLIDIGVIANKDENGCMEIVENSMLYVSWYKMPSGRYEINAYLT